MVGSRRIRATLPGADKALLEAFPGVTEVELRGDAITLICSNSDTALRALLEASPDVRDIEVTGAALEDAFVQLTHEEHAVDAP
jgi:ABC-2 type transport system ATP-binding protein